MSAAVISEQELREWLDGVIAAGVEVIAPRGAAYRPVARAAEVELGARLPARSIKEAFLPKTEVLVRWRRKKGGELEVEPDEPPPPRRAIVGVRPCDAAGPAIMDRVMGWGQEDDRWFGRRRSTVIVGLACAGARSACDEACFCETVGLGPTSRRGADLFLVPEGDGFRVEVLTAEGEALAAGRFGARVDAPPEPRPATDMRAIGEWMRTHFVGAPWDDIALRCHGCGACAAVCPTCHCFDIVDEPEGIDRGVRRRNWDTCQTAKFTVHASGHNPRGDQNSRFRQRLLHKFWIYPERFDEVLCTGCGRCVRVCPAGMDLPEMLGKLARLAGGGA